MIRIELQAVRYSRCFLILLLVLCAPVVTADRDPFLVQHASFNFNQTLLQLDLVVDSEIPGYSPIEV